MLVQAPFEVFHTAFSRFQHGESLMQQIDKHDPPVVSSKRKTTLEQYFDNLTIKIQFSLVGWLRILLNGQILLLWPDGRFQYGAEADSSAVAY